MTQRETFTVDYIKLINSSANTFFPAIAWDLDSNVVINLDDKSKYNTIQYQGTANVNDLGTGNRFFSYNP